MDERKQRYYDGLDPDQLRSAWLLGSLAIVLLGALGWGACATAPLKPTQPMRSVAVRTGCVDAELTVNGVAKRTPAPEFLAGFAVPDTADPVTVVYKAPGDSVGISKAFTFAAHDGAHQVLINDCIALTAPGFQVRFALPFTPLPKLARNGIWIEAGGQPWFALGASSFRLFELWLKHDPSFDAVVADLKGFNYVRVWTLYDVTFSGGDTAHLLPSEWPNFYRELTPFVRRMATEGFYVELTAFTGTKRLMPALAAQQAHLDQIVAVARTETNVLVETGNEEEQGDNAWEVSKLAYPTDVVISGGSVGGDNWPSEYGLPTLTYAIYHSNGTGAEFHRKMAHEPMDMANALGAPGFADENEKPTDSIDTDTPAHIAEGLARYRGGFQGCKLLINGCTFHSTDGRMSRVLTGLNRQAADAAIEGANLLPVSCQRAGGYEHPQELEGSQWLRVYRRGGNAACMAWLPK